VVLPADGGHGLDDGVVFADHMRKVRRDSHVSTVGVYYGMVPLLFFVILYILAKK
jgi:hypothetical protein